jgi:hypothetical protein
LPRAIGKIRKQSSALGAPRNSSRSRHIDRPWPKRILFFCSGRLLELFLGPSA